MRITNTMMTNQTLNNVGKSKSNLSEIENQMSTQKQITRPSDNPIIAIRALSLRSSLAEINQYLEHNIPDAESWFQITEGALKDMDTILQDVYQYCNQGSSDEFTMSDRSAVIEVLKQYKGAIYSECNTSFSDRYIFSGYKTDTPFTFETDEQAKRSYSITETFTPDQFGQVEKMKDSVADGTISNISAADRPETEKVYRLRLAYNGCKEGDLTVSYNMTETAGVKTYANTLTATSISDKDLQALISSNGELPANDCYYVYDTGELVFGNDLYNQLKTTNEIATTYEKDNFTKGDIRPEMYFDCKDITDPADVVTYTHRANETINYTVNFSQSLQVNTRGCDTLSHDIGRDIDDMCNALQAVKDIEDKIASIKKMQESGLYTAQAADLDSMLAAAEQEHDYALNYMEDMFSKEMTKIKGYQETVDLQLADLGARETRLKLTKSRITEQQTTFKDLKSSNEDVNLENAVINYSAATTLYQAALTAASDVVKQSLLNYI